MTSPSLDPLSARPHATPRENRHATSLDPRVAAPRSAADEARRVVTPLDARVLAIDCKSETERICDWLIATVARRFRRRGAVVAISGGVDSSVCLALAVRAFGSRNVRGLILPERESSPSSTRLASCVARQLSVECITQDISATLEAIGCYQWRDSAIRTIFPDYGPGWKSKVTIAGGQSGGFNHFKLVVQDPDGNVLSCRLPHGAYLQIVAAQNYKQRVRKTIEYFHADRLNFAVIGTPNRLEYDQGFFVKNGDGSADVKPIAHLYKSQVYALARFLGLPEEICTSTPTSDTYSLAQGQDEFYFGLPWAQMDLALWAFDHGLPPGELALALGISQERASYVYRDIEAKRAMSRYLHAPPQLPEPLCRPSPMPA